MFRLDRSESMRGWLILATLLYCGQFFISPHQLLLSGLYEDAIDLFYYARNYNEYTWLLPVVVCLPFAMKFCDDWQSRFFYMQVWRSSPGKYIGSKLWHTWITGGMVAALGSGLFFGILCTFAKAPVYPIGNMSEMAMELLIRSGSLWMHLFEVLFLAFVSGGFWALSAMAFSAYAPYRSLTLCFPVFLHRTWRVILQNIPLPPWMNLDALGMGFFRIYSPAITMLIAAGVFGVLSAICCLAFKFGVKRRMEHG